jgi:hypothetical protein
MIGNVVNVEGQCVAVDPLQAGPFVGTVLVTVGRCGADDAPLYSQFRSRRRYAVGEAVSAVCELGGNAPGQNVLTEVRS